MTYFSDLLDPSDFPSALILGVYVIALGDFL